MPHSVSTATVVALDVSLPLENSGNIIATTAKLYSPSGLDGQESTSEAIRREELKLREEAVGVTVDWFYFFDGILYGDCYAHEVCNG